MGRTARFRVSVTRQLRSIGFPADFYLIPLAAIIGCLGGLVATGFDWLVEASSEFFFGHFTGETLATTYALLLIMPAVGGLAVGIIQQYIARTGPTHGIPEVMEALARQSGTMPGKMGVYKAITASLTIGSGGSAGVEGPIIQIGSVLGSVCARFVRVSKEHMHTLVGCGAAAGLAGIFNAPIAGVLLVLEVMLRDFSIKTFMPIVVASVFGTAVAQAILGKNVAVFTVPQAIRTYDVALNELWAYALLGILCGLLALLLSWALRQSEHTFTRLKLPACLRPASGGLMLGVLGVLFMLSFGRPIQGYEPPPFYANGYSAIEALLNPGSYRPSTAPSPNVDHASELPGEHVATPALDEPATHATLESGIPTPRELHARHHTPIARLSIALLAGMLLCKFVGTVLTLGSGGSGGIFAPSLFMGATAGALFGMVLEALNIFPGVTPATYALAGMAGVIAGTVHAPLTAFLLVFEITQDYKVILPVMLVSILATTMSQIVTRDSIYTRWLRNRGIRVGRYADMTLLRRLEVANVPLQPAVVVHPQDPAQKLIELAEEYAAADYVVCDDENKYVGMVVGEDVRTTLVQREAIPLMIVGELMRTNLPTVTRNETLDIVLDKFSQHDVASLAVVDDNLKIRGVITRSRLMRQYQQILEQG